MLIFACAGCGRSLTAPPSKVGRKVRCPKCGGVTVVPADPPPAAAASSAGGNDPTVARPEDLRERFEAAWEAGGRPAIEDFLPGVSGDAAEPLFVELLRLDVRYRKRKGESPRLADYLSRFPDRRAVIERQLARKARPPVHIPGYEILGTLGKGGMGIVYRARDLKLNRLVALKTIRHGEDATEDELQRFVGEAEAAARLKHPNLVPIYEVGRADGTPYFSLELCDGGTLAAHLRAGPLAGREAARLMAALARAVHHAHEMGIVHRDLKPANVLRADDGTWKVTDFGLARRLGETGKTRTGQFVGTPGYAAPEQAAGDQKRVGRRTDVYALGAVLYECVTGRPPFQGPDLFETLRQVANTDPVPPRQLQPKLSRDLETICLKCLRKEPGERYATARDLADDLRRYLRDEPVAARPVGRLERVVKWVRRNRKVAALGATAAACLVLVLTVAPLAMWATATAQHGESEAKKREELAKGKLAEVTYPEKLRQADEAMVAEKFKGVSGLLDPLEALDPQGKVRGWEWHFQQTRLRAATGGGGWPIRQLGKSSIRIRDAVLSAHRNGSLPEAPVRPAWSPDSKRIAALTADGVSVWRVEGGDPVCTVGRADPGGHPHFHNFQTAALSPAGDQIAAVPNDGQLQLWDARGSLIAEVADRRPNAMAWRPDGRQLAMLHSDGSLQLLDVKTRKVTAALREKGKVVRRWEGLHWSADGSRLAATVDHRTENRSTTAVAVWDVAAAGPPRCHPLPANTRLAALRPDGKQFLVAEQDGVRILDADKGTEVGVLAHRLAPNEPTAAAWSPDGGRLALATAEGVFVVDPLKAGPGHRLVADDAGDPGTVHVAWSADGKRLHLRGNKATLVIDAGTEERLAENLPPGLHLSGDGRVGLRVGRRSLSVWDVGANRQAASIVSGGAAAITRVAWGKDAGRIATGRRDGGVDVWEVDSGKLVQRLEGLPRLLRERAEEYLKKGARVADPDVDTWRHASANWLRALAFSPDGERLAALSESGEVMVWKADGTEVAGWFAGPPSAAPPWNTQPTFLDLAWSPKGDRLALCTTTFVSIRDVRTGVEVNEVKVRANQVAWDPTGDRLATDLAPVGAEVPSKVSPVAVWDPREPNHRLALLTVQRPAEKGPGPPPFQHPNPVTGKVDPRYSVADFSWSPDGRRLIVAERDRTPQYNVPPPAVRVWDPAAGEALMELPGDVENQGELPRFGFRWSPDGWKVAGYVGNGNQSTTLQVWDATPVTR